MLRPSTPFPTGWMWEGRRLPVIVSGRKPACWHCGEIGHLSAVCPGKKAPKKPDQNPRHPHTCCNKQREKKEAPRSLAHFSGNKKPPLPLRHLRLVPKRRGASGWPWEKVGGRSNQRILIPESRPQVGTNSSPTSKSYAERIKSPTFKKFPPKTPPKQSTHPLVRSFGPGREKFEQLLEFKKRLDPTEEVDPPNQDPLDPPLHHPSSPEL